MRLIDAESGQRVCIMNIEGGQGVNTKLRQLSLRVGDEILVKNKAPLKGPILVEDDGRSVALGRGVASMVEVELCA